MSLHCTSQSHIWSKTLGNELFFHSAAAYKSRHHLSQIFERCQILKGPVLYSGDRFNASLILCAPHWRLIISMIINAASERLRWSRGSVLAFGTQVRGFTPGRRWRIFRAKKILSTPSFRGEVKPSVPCRSFTACKRSLNGVEVVILAKLPDISHPQFHLPPLGALARWHTWRRLVAKVGMSNHYRTISLKAAVRSCINKQKHRFWVFT